MAFRSRSARSLYLPCHRRVRSFSLVQQTQNYTIALTKMESETRKTEIYITKFDRHTHLHTKNQKKRKKTPANIVHIVFRKRTVSFLVSFLSRCAFGETRKHNVTTSLSIHLPIVCFFFVLWCNV